MNRTPLEEAIRKEAEQVIGEIRKTEAREITMLEEACTAEIESFRKQNEAETDRQIQQELNRLKNRDMLERRKRTLQTVDAFITRMVKETVQELRDNNRYKEFLLAAAGNALGQIEGRAEVCLKGEDITFQEELVNTLRTTGKNKNMVVHKDSTIRWGGCVVYDKREGRIFNSTIERIYYRKLRIIRLEVVKMLREKGFTA